MKVEEKMMVLLSLMHIITFTVASIYVYIVGMGGLIIFTLMLFGNGCSLLYFKIKGDMQCQN